MKERREKSCMIFEVDTVSALHTVQMARLKPAAVLMLLYCLLPAAL